MVRQRATPVIAPTPMWEQVLVLPENRSAVRAAQRIAAGRKSAATRLVLHGAPGVGKSAVVGALITSYLNSPTSHTVRQVSAAELPRKGRAQPETEFDELVETDLLIVEDLQHLSHRDTLAVCHMLDAREVHARPTVLTATVGPAGLTALPRRLGTRLASGLVVRLEMPGVISRRLLAESFAASGSLALSPEAIDWVARKADGIRPLLGYIETLKAVPKSAGPVTLAQAQEWLSDPSESGATSRLNRIVTRVASAYQVRPKEVLGPSRLRSLLLPRQVAMTLARDLTRLPLADIGRHFGGRDHTTVLNAVRRIESLAGSDAVLASRLKELRTELE